MKRIPRAFACGVAKNGTAARFMSDDWSDGSDGYAWKARSLNEKRSLALDYLGDVKKRVPIHNAVRMRCDLNRKSLDTASESIRPFFRELSEIDDFEDSSVSKERHSVADEVQNAFDELLSSMEECSLDELPHVHRSDRDFLKDEFLGDETERMKSMKEWMKLRRETADYQSYASVPERERNNWSAWYLRNVRSDPGGQE